MSEKFVVKHKNIRYKNDSQITMTLRVPETIRKEFDKLAEKSNYSRNQLMCMALQYALDNLQFIPEENDKEQAEQ